MMAWLCTRDETFDGSQICIVTGPNIEMATKLIRRTKEIFEPKLGLTFSNKETMRNQFSYDMSLWVWDKLMEWEYWPVDNLINRPKAFKSANKLEFKPS
jgi:DNA relaxase NicK